MNDALRWWLRWRSLRVAVAVDLAVAAVWATVTFAGDFELNSALIALAVVLIPTTYAALCCNEAAAARWAEERGANLGPDWAPVLYRHLLRTRVARTLGVTVGLAAPFMLMSYFNADPGRFPSFVHSWSVMIGYWPMQLGYLVASVFAELTKPVAAGESGGGARAVLSRRRLADFVDPGVRRIAWVFLVLCAASGFVAMRWGPEVVAGFRPGAEIAAIRASWELLGAFVAGTVAAASVLAASLLCRRRESVSDERALAYEELTRAATVNALVGASIAAMATASAQLISPALDPLYGSGSAWVWLTLPLGLIPMLGLGIWAGCGTKLVFRNRRIDRFRAAAART